MPPSTFGEILDRAASFAPDDWRAFAREIQYPFADEFYFFERDPETRLSSDEVNAAYLDVEGAAADRAARAAEVPLQPAAARRGVRAGCAALPGRARVLPRGREVPAAHEGRARREQAAKVPLFGCRDCGDCSLPEIAYVCPESQCAKNQRNGPCGGTREGLCEVYDTECIWSQAYERLKAYGEEESMLDGPVVVKDNALARTSAWANTFLGRDHSSQLGQPDPE